MNKNLKELEKMTNLEYLEKIKDIKYRKLLSKGENPVLFNLKERKVIALEVIAEELCILNELMQEKCKIYDVSNH